MAGDSRWARHDPPIEVPPDPSRPRPGRTLKRAASLCYDYLGVILGASCLWAVITLGLLVIGEPLLAGPLLGRVLFGTLLAGVESLLAAGLLELAVHIVDRNDPSFGHLWHGIVRLGRRAVALGWISWAVCLILGADAAVLAGRPQPALQIAAVPFIYLLLAFALIQLAAWPLLVRQPISPLPALRRAALLWLDNPVFLSAIAGALAILGAVSAVSGILLVLFFPGFAAVTSICVVDDLMAKYRALDGTGGLE